jgi:hypothetical protein
MEDPTSGSAMDDYLRAEEGGVSFSHQAVDADTKASGGRHSVLEGTAPFF